MPETEEKLSPPASDEERLELIAQAKESLLLRKMVEQSGWHKILAPRLQKYRASLMAGLMKAQEHKDFLTSQQAVNTIDLVFSLVDTGIQAGLIASQRLSIEDEQRAGKTDNINGQNQAGD